MDELKLWLEDYKRYLQNKITKMKQIVPEHRNIPYFQGQLSSVEKTLEKFNEIINKK